ncbi:hypothetical protein GGS23DRAFT_17217 [Durotheca rogersii]|uniref:uncharacterized protein n=1 Tax=Durotheca rogersii TaxID=419775 RepID=UPI00221ED08C|nr:uncharacterized protein GGS23DRAFT_17217 [Durotheca rogersii]KAI5868198.1 hypothetical protein GGS23DRAFT_17217 [Durotheca rogersii]
MPRHITVVPASTKAGRETIRVLLASESKPLVRGIYRDTSKVPAEFASHSNFEAVQGDVGTGAGLDFSRSDAVFYIPPPIYDGTDQGEWATQTATNVKSALESAPNVQRLLLFSSVGSQYNHGVGILRLNHISDKILENSVPEVLIIRPGYFHEDWAHLLEIAKADPPVLESWLTPLEHKVPMVGLQDIGETCAETLLAESTKPSPYYFKLFGPRHYGSLDLRSAVEEITGKEVQLKIVERGELPSFFAKLLPPTYVQELVDMTTAVLPGGTMAGDFEYDEGTVRGRVELVDSLRKLYTKEK